MKRKQEAHHCLCAGKGHEMHNAPVFNHTTTMKGKVVALT
jgi:hypothetical protein